MGRYLLTISEDNNTPAGTTSKYVFNKLERAIKMFDSSLLMYDFDANEGDHINREGPLNEWAYSSEKDKCLMQASIYSTAIITLEELGVNRK